MKTYRLPDGRSTRSQAVYSRTWWRMGNKVGRLLGMKLQAFDPGFSFAYVERNRIIGPSFIMSTWVATRLLERVKK